MEQGTSQRTELGHSLDAVVRLFLSGLESAELGLPGGHRGYKILSFVERSECQSQARIAGALGVDRTVMTYLIDELESEGLVTRRPDPTDRRARLIELTPSGVERLGAAHDTMLHVEQHVLSALAPDEAEQFRSLLAKLAAERPADEGPGPLCSIQP